MAKPELGSKRQCQSCSAKFFDLNKEPILCPKCGAEFQVVALRAPVRAASSDDDEADEIPNVDLVSLDDADAEKAVAAVEDDIEIEDDGDADETFLEEEEGDADDVSDLIDSDLQDDEES